MLSRQLGERRHEAISLRRMAITYIEESRHKEAMPYAQAALALHREVGDRNEECHALNVIGIIYAWEGLCDESEAYLRQSLALSEEVNSGMSFLLAMENLIDLHYRAKGQYEAGLQFLEALIARHLFSNDEFLTASLTAEKAHLLADLGQYRTALPLIQDLVVVSEKIMSETIFPAQLLALVGKWHAELGEFEIVHQYLDRIQKYANRSERAADTADLLMYEAYAAWLEGGKDAWRDGVEKAQQAVNLLRGTIWRYDMAYCLYVLGNLQLALGLNQNALESTQEMIDLSRDAPMVIEYFLHTHSRALRANGSTAKADRYLGEACQRVHLVAEQTHDPALRQSWLENVRHNRQILAECSTG